MGESPATRRRGEALESAIFDAVWAELAEVGYAEFTIGGVAARARTSKAVLYRRWPGRAELVLAALAQHVPTADEIPDTGSLRSDVIALLRSVVRRKPLGIVDSLWGLLAESARDPELAVLVRTELANQLRAGPMSVVVERAVARGEVHRERLSPRRIRLPLDLMRGELLLHGSVSDDAIVEVVDDIFLPLVRAGHRGR